MDTSPSWANKIRQQLLSDEKKLAANYAQEKFTFAGITCRPKVKCAEESWGNTFFLTTDCYIFCRKVRVCFFFLEIFLFLHFQLLHSFMSFRSTSWVSDQLCAYKTLTLTKFLTYRFYQLKHIAQIKIFSSGPHITTPF